VELIGFKHCQHYFGRRSHRLRIGHCDHHGSIHDIQLNRDSDREFCSGQLGFNSDIPGGIFCAGSYDPAVYRDRQL